MDGPFFSLMPFGLTGYHSITTVSRTPHFTSYDELLMIVVEMKSIKIVRNIKKLVYTVIFFQKQHFLRWFR